MRFLSRGGWKSRVFSLTVLLILPAVLMAGVGALAGERGTSVATRIFPTPVCVNKVFDA